MTSNKKNNVRTLAIAALVLGIVGLTLSWVPFIGLISAVLAVVLGAVSIRSQGRSLAIAGLVLGVVGTFVSLLFLITTLSYFGTIASKSEDNSIMNNAGIIKGAVYQYTTSHGGQLPESRSDLTPYISKSVSDFSIASRTYGDGAILPRPDEILIVTGARCVTAQGGKVSVKDDPTQSYVLVVTLPSGGLYCP